MSHPTALENEIVSKKNSSSKVSAIIFFVLLFNLASLGQVVSDIYLPALPILKQALNTSIHAIQLSITWYFCGFSISHLFYGTLSDSLGRKRPLITGLIICVIGTVICAFTSSISMFDLGRLLQGLGTGASATLYRSILRDVHSGKKLAIYSSYIGVGRVFLLASAPLIGAYLLKYWDWRAIFDFLFVYSTLCLLGCVGFLSETCHYAKDNSLSLRRIINDAVFLIKSPVFMGYTLCIMLTFGGIISWLTTIPILLQKQVGLSALQFGWLAAFCGSFFIVGGTLNAFLINRFGIKAMLYVGLIISLVAGLFMLSFAYLGYMNVFVIIAPITLYVVGASMIFPNAYTGAFDPFPKLAGVASAVFGFLQMLGGAMSSFAISYAYVYTQKPLAITLTVGTVLSLIIIALTTRARFYHQLSTS